MFEWASLGVPEHILDRLQALGLTSPTPIQVATIPGALANGKFDEGDDLRKDIYGAAPTGSGKTLAFAIPMVAQIVAEKEKKLPENFSSSNSSTSTSRLRGLILTPTRELAVQIKKHIEAITIGGSGSSNRDLVRTALVVGGLAIQKQERILSHHQPDIVVATPGRLWEIISSGSVPYLDRKSIQAVQYLVVDEADRMVERGHFEELKQVIGLLNEQQQQQPSVSRRQTFIFSATLTLQKKKSKKLKHRKKADSETPNLIDLLRLDQSRLLVVDLTEGGLRSTPSADRLQEEIIHCLKEEKDVYLYYFLLEQQQQNSDPKSQNHKTIVFANSIDCLRRLLNLLRFLGLAPLVVHSSMPQKRRLTAIERFTTNASSSSSSSSGQVLLATDVAARGLDIPAVSAVVHYQCPRSAEIYIHRSGRTARGQRASGRSLILCDPQEEAFFLRDFCRILGKNANGKTDLAEYPINSKALRRCKERVRLATACDVLEHGLRKERSEVSWFKEAARAAEMDDSEEEDKDDEEEFDAAVDHGGKSKGNSLVNQRKLKAYQRQLSGLLKCSILFPK
ncbi:ATP-dependent RNA helicase ddx24 [Tyrophagus putrescentiae]|nr:ATP-dependent RNA helicase ddx24 [Tyrophagus putrescentiae]